MVGLYQEAHRPLQTAWSRTEEETGAWILQKGPPMEPGFYWVSIYEGDDRTIAEVEADGKIWLIGSGDDWLPDHVTFHDKIPQPQTV